MFASLISVRWAEYNSAEMDIQGGQSDCPEKEENGNKICISQIFFVSLQREREKRTGGGCRGNGQERDVPVI